jgi:acyl-coenzyme A synthetase/AMP-(fatty) acid ligase
VPQAIEFRTELPKSLVGKILRRELVTAARLGGLNSLTLRP